RFHRDRFDDRKTCQRRISKQAAGKKITDRPLRLQRDGGSMARIKHIAIRTDNVEKTATFYKEIFDLKKVALGRNGGYLSDDHINLAILRRQPEIEDGDRVGIDHLGFK